MLSRANKSTSPHLLAFAGASTPFAENLKSGEGRGPRPSRESHFYNITRLVWNSSFGQPHLESERTRTHYWRKYQPWKDRWPGHKVCKRFLFFFWTGRNFETRWQQLHGSLSGQSFASVKALKKNTQTNICLVSASDRPPDGHQEILAPSSIQPS